MNMYRPIVVPGILLGIGLGGFFDGIVLHQILQWHHLLSSAGYPPNSVENLQINTLADGLFHAATWIFTVMGVFALWRVIQRKDVVPSGRVLFGAMLAGWGGFNLVEGIIDHHLLGIHHVREGAANVLLWDIGFLVWGALMLIGGWWLIQSAHIHAEIPSDTPRRMEQTPSGD
jgi:uncharacterized membrane protein